VELKGLVWLGTRTSRFNEMVAFAENVLGLTRKHTEPGFVVFSLPNGDTVEVFDDQHPAGGHPDGVVAGFLVDDAERTAAEMRAAGVAVSEIGSAGEFRWVYFTAPDGNRYEVTSGPY
jgi:catechol 2,3-dioxygenase-like lactoylglutathione lyase family enzyme